MPKPQRKFYRTTILVTVLSEDGPVPAKMTLEDIEHEISTGDWVGIVSFLKKERLSRKQAVQALADIGSDASFFGLDEAGKDLA